MTTCAALDNEIRRFADNVRGQDLSRRVPTCPEWNIAQLITHVGGVHRWSAAMVRDRATSRLDRDTIDFGVPEHQADLPEWLLAGAKLLAQAFDGVDPVTPMWAWGPEQSVRFWARRQLHETVVHSADAVLAVGQEPVIVISVACDAIDEFLENLPSMAYFSPQVAELKGNGETIHFHATDSADTHGEWMITLVPEGFTVTHGHGKGDVAVRAPASDLLLLAAGRRSVRDARFQTFGDIDLLGRWLSKSSFG